MNEEDKLLLEQALIRSIKAELLKKKIQGTLKEFETSEKSVDGVLNKALQRHRRLPGAKLAKSGRPMTDYMTKVKKKVRRLLNSEFFKYRGKVVKGPQKSLVTSARKLASKPFKK